METPNTQLFLNSPTNEEVSMFKSAIYASAVYCHLVNQRHIYPAIELDELANMKSTRPQDGEK